MAARTPHLDDLEDLDRHDPALRAWLVESIRRLDADAQRSADTHLVRIPLPERWGIDLYLKDESTHLTGSLKHRLARSLFMYALVNGWLAPGMPVVEASSGSTAVSEAHFARVLGLPFIAVMPRSTSVEKIRLIEAQGGTCHFVDTADEMCAASQRLASELGGHFLDQFTYAERATDWRGHNNIAESILRQMADEPHPVPAWLVVAAGTGGTSATLGRYFRYRRLATRLCVADVENSAFFDGWADHDPGCRVEGSSRIEGIGRPQIEPSFIPAIVDRMIRVPDAASVAGAHFLSERLGRRVGASTGTNLIAVARIVQDMLARGETGSIVTLLCDSGERYGHSYFDRDWVAGQGWDLQPWLDELEAVFPRS
ncbi:PLP-dependent cysteine synthase family protein [Propioniciclava sp. MC1595]|uniref:PLP-dependent cysteine synthase family protein n=1 Tax=Propioniciclava sp. MC1595 TaxID=2760308 RepID=UPI00166243DA|nr:PLP-dependent cysteine synthase family protein [Propioniciclava sp. MC1595]MBB1496473.1 PLP-dependent cysteine synthase family protein [Propioniciclava sp. MC1595]QTE27308.1 PLP-dependent cysteine synthase family protein [Propioniciclava sp. MC1595]